MTTMTFANFISGGSIFLSKVLSDLRSKGFATEGLFVDHLCFRVGTEEEYQAYKELLSTHARLLVESPVNGRMIATYKLSEGFQSEGKTVQVVELPSPKKGSAYTTGFEHLEIVIKESFEEFQKLHSQLTFAPATMKALNSELCLKLGEYQVKFHHLSLEQVIAIELSEISS